jgi:Methyltransferase domain
MKRRPAHELLDSDSGTAEEVAASLRDLRSFNERFGGIETTRELIRTVIRETGKMQLSLLEAASGTGFVPTRAARELEPDGLRLRITLLDRAITHLPKGGGAQAIVADALTLPFADAAFDLVSCSLFLHHLSSDQAVQFGREALRVSRIAVLVNDLVRHPLHLGLAYAGMPFFRSRLTRHDAPASVRQAYTVEEMRDLLVRSGAARVGMQTRYLFRLGAIAWK